jgi:DNA-binding response OmpR family regulator
MKKKVVLIVEDEESELRALADKFSREGFKILKAKDGQAGYEIAVDKKPDLVITDILMPRMGGLEMIGNLRKNTWGKQVPIVVLTNVEAGCENAQKIAENQKCACYLIKSGWKIQDIVNKVKKELRVK